MPHSPSQPAKALLLDHVRRHIGIRHYSIRAGEAYVQALRRFILFHDKRRPAGMGAGDARQYLAHLASNAMSPHPRRMPASRPSSFSTATSSGVELPGVGNIERAKCPARRPGASRVSPLGLAHKLF